MSKLRIGIDLGGTKIEGVSMDARGLILHRLRIDTPKEDYDAILRAVVGVVDRLDPDRRAAVGICGPGSISPRTGLCKNSNSVCLNGRPLDCDLARAMGRPTRLANDADCLALSEATDGAAAGMGVVFAVIIGTGAGGGIAIDGRVHHGGNAIGGEWGHIPLAAMTAAEYPGPLCYCGRRGCNESFVSGAGLENDYARATGRERLTAHEIERRAAAGDADCEEAILRYEDRLARGLSSVANVLDPDAIVLGGGMSKMLRLYESLPKLMPSRVFGGDFATPIMAAKHGDSSGVRGAAWLWPAD